MNLEKLAEILLQDIAVPNDVQKTVQKIVLKIGR